MEQDGNNNIIIRLNNKMWISGKQYQGYKMIRNILFPGTCLKSINIMKQVING